MPFGVDDALMIGAGLAGAAGGLFGGGSGGGRGGGPQTQSMNQSTRWNQTQTTSPWAGVAPYMFGAEGVSGIFPEAARLYGQTGWTPAMQGFTQGYTNDLINRRNVYNQGGGIGTGVDMLRGNYDPRLTSVGSVTPTTFTPADARATQGALDPTRTLGDFMAGGQTNPFVEKQGKAITDLLTRNMLETVMPNIRSGAIEAGQYGSNRQAQAEAGAMSRLNTDLAPALAQLGGDAYENEQRRRFDTAMGLNTQASAVADANANRALDAARFNVDTTLASNAQEMQRAAQVVNNRMAGNDFMAGSMDLQNQNYSDLMRSLNLKSDYDWSNLGRYGQAISPAFGFTTTDGAGTSNTQGQTTTTGGGGGSGGGIAGAIGGAAGGLALANSVFGPGGIWGGGRASPIRRTGSTQTYYGPGVDNYGYF